MEVQAFYDRYPYPPPVDDLDAYRRRWQDHQRRRADFHLFWPTKSYCEDCSILIAGCGTSQAAKYALRWPAARITAIDFSATSVQHTEQLKIRWQACCTRLPTSVMKPPLPTHSCIRKTARTRCRSYLRFSTRTVFDSAVLPHGLIYG